MPAKAKSSDPQVRPTRKTVPGKKDTTPPSKSIAQRFELSEWKIQRRLNYFRIQPADEAAMAEIHNIIDPMIDSIVDAFYSHIGTFLPLPGSSRTIPAPKN